MTSEKANPVTDLADREVVNARLFAAPRERVFEAFADSSHLVHWWGPLGFTNEFHEFDLRPGGAWRFVMRGPDGTEYDIVKEFVEVVRPERIVLRHVDAAHGFKMTMTFAEHAEGTLLTWRMLFDSASEVANLKEFLAQANEQNFDRLQAFLGSEGPPGVAAIDNSGAPSIR